MDSCSWLLLRHLAQQAPPLEMDDQTPPSIDDGAPSGPDTGSNEVVTDDRLESSKPVVGDLNLPRVAFDDARRIMTRTDFLEPLDHLHVSPLSIINPKVFSC